MFAGFDEFEVTVTGTRIHGRRGGTGSPVLLLHGIPQTHLMWHRVAPALAERFTVVATDLRGYGDSGTPPGTPDHATYSMRALALDQLEVMQALGFPRFAVVGHDRGARCGYRMALDHPDAVDQLAVIDILPTGDVFDHADRDFARSFWIWSFLAAPAPVPEELIGHAPAVLVSHLLDTWSATPNPFPADIRAAYLMQFSRPANVHAICEQYRAGASLDAQHDYADRAQHRRIRCPVLVLWSEASLLPGWPPPLQVWRQWADDVRGHSIAAGHFIPEEAPAETIRELTSFLAGTEPPRA